MRQMHFNPVVVGAVLLMLSALAKGIGSSTEHVLLSQRAAEFQIITHRQLLLGTTWVEVVVATYLFFGRDPVTRSRVLFGLVALFWTYRAATWAAGITGPCPCLGNMWHWTSLSAGTVEWMASGLLVMLSLCAAAGWLMARRTGRGPRVHVEPSILPGRAS